MFPEQIKSPPPLLTTPGLRSLQKGPLFSELNQDVELKFEWTGKTEPIISWSRDEEKIQPSARFEIISVGNEFILLIHEVNFTNKISSVRLGSKVR